MFEAFLFLITFVIRYNFMGAFVISKRFNDEYKFVFTSRRGKVIFTSKSYELRFEKGVGTHSGKHAGSILPESLIWLWSDIKIK